MANQDILSDESQMEIDQNTRFQLKQIATWARIIALAAFVSYGLTIIGYFIGSGTNPSFTGLLFGVIIGILINWFLYKFSLEAKEGLETESSTSLESAFRNLSTYFKIIGIIVLIVLVCVGLILLFGILGAGIGSLTQ